MWSETNSEKGKSGRIMTREEAIKRLHKYAKYAYGIWHDGDADIEAIDMAIEALQQESVKYGEWELDPNGMDWNIPAWRCSECGFVANYIGVEVNGLGNNPMNWAGSNFCPNCGAKMDKG